mgnify:CR=1 FL=1
MSAQTDVVQRYASGTGVLILLGGGIACVVAYRLMTWIGRLPEEPRVLS